MACSEIVGVGKPAPGFSGRKMQIHRDAHLKNFRKIDKQGIDKFLEGKKHWCSKIK